MPELPEVETVRRGLSVVLDGRTLRRVIVRRANLRRPFPDNFAAALEGRRVGMIGRRAKYLVVPLDNDQNVLIHLGMSGRMMILDGSNTETGPHDHVEFSTDEGVRVVYRDPRRFGLMDLCGVSEMETHPLLCALGPEPLGNGFNATVLAEALQHRNGPIKTVLLDQGVVAGLGNIYVCESLFYAGISPFRSASSLTASELSLLVDVIRDVLLRAVEAGGSSLRDHRRPDGELGYFQHSFAVYGREGEPCPHCLQAGEGSCAVVRVAQGGRSTFYCSKTQL